MKSRAVFRPSDHRCWEIATTSAFALFGVCLGSGLQASPIAWTGTVMIIAYVLGAVTVTLGVCRLTNVRFPLPGPPGPSLPTPQDPQGDPRSDRSGALGANRPSAQDATSGVPAEPPPLSADQRWLKLVTQLVEQVGWDSWQDRVYPFFDPNSPWVSADFVRKLYGATEWIYRRAWPAGHPEFREAIDTYGQVISDLLETFSQHAEESPSGKSMMTEPFYKDFDEGLDATASQELRFREAIAEYQNHVRLLADLVLEATRYGNHIAQMARTELDPDFRAEEGALLVRMTYGYFQVGLVKPEFRPEDFEHGQPYKDLQSFEDDRAIRDITMKEDGK